jgi:hypothetical protein
MTRRSRFYTLTAPLLAPFLPKPAPRVTQFTDWTPLNVRLWTVIPPNNEIFFSWTPDDLHPPQDQ